MNAHPRNLERCITIKDMAPLEAARALRNMAALIRGPVAMGVWEGAVTDRTRGPGHIGDHVAVFTDTSMIAPFGPDDDDESQACAALFAIAHGNAAAIALALENLERFKAVADAADVVMHHYADSHWNEDSFDKMVDAMEPLRQSLVTAGYGLPVSDQVSGSLP